MQSHQQKASTPAPPQVGYVIDAQGREIPITEDMIQKACRELDQAQKTEAKQK
ncbi:PA1571 family protein [Ectopseudomonas mendocina]|uniref:PA1571 family protein n=1 Tax=Ectopseudomonas mendocina TaxID=300 RepID=A0ABZ2RL16_ECTME